MDSGKLAASLTTPIEDATVTNRALTPAVALQATLVRYFSITYDVIYRLPDRV